MLTEYRSVDSTVLADIRKQMADLAPTIAELEESLLAYGLFWLDLYLYEAIIEPYEAAQTLLNIFTNTDEPTSPTPSEVQHCVYKFTTLTASIQRSTSLIEPHEDPDIIFWQQEFLTPFTKFCLQVSKLNDDIGNFC